MDEWQKEIAGAFKDLTAVFDEFEGLANQSHEYRDRDSDGIYGQCPGCKC